MIDLPPDPVPYIMNVEHRVDETITIKCGEIPQDVSLAEADRYAGALDRFLEVPENTADIDPSFYRFVRGVRRLNFDTQYQVIQHGGWELVCAAPLKFAWQMQPIPTTRFTAFVAYDERDELWFVRDLRVTRFYR